MSVSIKRGGLPVRREQIDHFEEWLTKKVSHMTGSSWLKWSALVCVMMMAGWYWLIHEPLSVGRQKMEMEAEQAMAQTVAVENYQHAHLDFSVYQKDLSGQQERADKALPDEMEQGKFLGLLEYTAKRNHVELEQVEPGQTFQMEEACVLPIKVRFRCGYFDLLAFLREAGDGERFIRIDRVAVHGEHDGLDCTMNLSVFSLPAAISEDS